MAALPPAFGTAAAALAAGKPPPLPKTADAEAARKAGREFESFFLSQMLEQMFKGISTGGLFGGGPGEAVFRPLLLQEYGRILAKAGGVGIGDMVTREILKLQEAK